MSALKQVIALLFKKRGKDILSEKEFVFSASIDYRWYTPKEAQKLLEIGLKEKLLIKKDGFVKPAFDYRHLEIPPDFRPGKEVLEEKEEIPPFTQIIDRISTLKGMTKREVVAKINKLQERLGVEVEVAGLVLARDLEIPIHDLIDPVKKDVLMR